MELSQQKWKIILEIFTSLIFYGLSMPAFHNMVTCMVNGLFLEDSVGFFFFTLFIIELNISAEW